jgi:hypothetical protein
MAGEDVSKAIGWLSSVSKIAMAAKGASSLTI